MEKEFNGVKIILKHGDITEEKVDVIVNAANNQLQGGGGVDGAIHRAGGPEITKECDKIRKKQGECHTGQAVVTSGGKLPVKKIIHAVGPIWRGGTDEEAELLRETYINSLKLALEHGAKTVAFPSISTGAYGFPIEHAASIALTAVHDFIQEHKGLKEVRFILFSQRDLEIYESALKKLS